ncbi:MAG: FAD-dependent oxidoreductase [Anaerolineae bacterium]|nr:FAD-dependent oxidoreductase [Anaerolineae bacterium]
MSSLSNHTELLTPKDVTYDLIVIGSGPAGESAAQIASYFGYRAAIIERHQPGGTPTTRGGAPTKTLREAALALTGFYQQEVYGLDLGVPPAVALDKVAERTRQVCQSLQKTVAQRIAVWEIAYLYGTARLIPGGKVRLTETDGRVRELSAQVILIATGSRPLRPANVPFDDPAVFDVDDIYSLTALPRSLCIVGGGPVGVEFATIFNALGTSVTLVQAGDQLAPTMDGEVAQMMAQIFEGRGVRVILDAGTEAVKRVGDRLQVSLSNGAICEAEAVFFAAGRRPNTEELGLEEVGVAVDKRGYLVVDQNFQTSVPGVYAAGDVLGPGLSSVAMEQGRVAACRAFHIDFLERVDPIPISAVYGMPEMAGVGLTEEQCQEQGLDYAVGRAAFANIPRGAISGHDGLLKLIFRRDDRRLLGVHCLGEIASEIIGAGQMVLHYGGTIDIFSQITLPTPTYSYAYKNAAFDGLRRVMKRP